MEIIKAQFQVLNDGRLHFEKKKVETNPPTIVRLVDSSSVRVHSAFIGWLLALIGRSIKIYDETTKESAYANANSLRKWAYRAKLAPKEKAISLVGLAQLMQGWVKTHQPSITMEQLMQQLPAPMGAPAASNVPSKLKEPPPTRSHLSPIDQELAGVLDPLSQAAAKLPLSQRIQVFGLGLRFENKEGIEKHLKSALEEAKKEEAASLKFPLLRQIAKEQAKIDKEAANATMAYVLQETGAPINEVVEDAINPLKEACTFMHKMPNGEQKAILLSHMAAQLKEACTLAHQMPNDQQKVLFLMSIAEMQAPLDKEEAKKTIKKAYEAEKAFRREGTDFSLRTRIAEVEALADPEGVQNSFQEITAMIVASSLGERWKFHSLRDMAKVQANIDKKGALTTLEKALEYQKDLSFNELMDFAKIEVLLSSKGLSATLGRLFAMVETATPKEKIDCLIEIAKVQATVENAGAPEGSLNRAFQEALSISEKNASLDSLIKIAKAQVEIGKVDTPMLENAKKTLDAALAAVREDQGSRSIQPHIEIAKMQVEIDRMEGQEAVKGAKETLNKALEIAKGVKPIDRALDFVLDVVRALAVLDKEEAKKTLIEALQAPGVIDKLKNEMERNMPPMMIKLNNVLESL